MFIYPDERHEKNQPKHRYSIYVRNVDWFNFWLRDKEDPDPAKAEQYKRWHELRKLQGDKRGRKKAKLTRLYHMTESVPVRQAIHRTANEK
jgi:hypothetical protein